MAISRTDAEEMLRKIMMDKDISRYTTSVPPPNPSDMLTTTTVGSINHLKKFKKLVASIVVEGKFTEDNMQQMRQLVAEEVINKL